MPIQLPNLDNRTYQELVEEMVASIPKYTTEWTNYNPAEPGIAIIELLAYITETLTYRANLVPVESNINFLKLIAGAEVYLEGIDPAHQRLLDYIASIDGVKPELLEMQEEADRFLNSKFRAVTESDFKELIVEAFPGIRRVEVITAGPELMILIIPDQRQPISVKDLTLRVREFLEPRRLVGTFITVKPAEYISIGLKIGLICENHMAARQENIVDAVKAEVASYLDPVSGGPEKGGWPYGRSLTIYELFHIVEEVPGVKHVRQILLKQDNGDWAPFKELKTPGLVSLPDKENIEVEVAIDNHE